MDVPESQAQLDKPFHYFVFAEGLPLLPPAVQVLLQLAVLRALHDDAEVAFAVLEAVVIADDILVFEVLHDVDFFLDGELVFGAFLQLLNNGQITLITYFFPSLTDSTKSTFPKLPFPIALTVR